MKTVNMLGVEINCITLDELIECALQWGGGSQKRTIMYVNAHCLNTAIMDHSYRRILGWADLVIADGIGVVWGSRFLGGCKLQKLVAGAWINKICENSARMGVSVYILAGKPGVATLARDVLSRNWPGLKIAGTCDGYFQTKSEETFLLEINETKPDVLFVGMGMPYQEKWLYEHRKQLLAPLCWAVGALFDYIAGSEKRSPGAIDSLGLEWFWRLMMDPKGKWKRYLVGNPVFIYHLIKQKAGFTNY